MNINFADPECIIPSKFSAGGSSSSARLEIILVHDTQVRVSNETITFNVHMISEFCLVMRKPAHAHIAVCGSMCGSIGRISHPTHTNGWIISIYRTQAHKHLQVYAHTKRLHPEILKEDYSRHT